MTALQSKAVKTANITLWSRIAKQRTLLLMVLPAIACAALFVYTPMWGMLMAFFDYNPGLGLSHSPFVGLKYFIRFFTDSQFPLLIRNSFAISLLNIAFGTVSSIVFALLLNEVRSTAFKKTVQTISYLPHFVSYVVVATIALTLLSPSGFLLDSLVKLGLLKEAPVLFTEEKAFWWLVASLNTWKEMGWSAIIYIAAIAGIEPQLYEAAMVDGAGRFRRMWHITLTGIRPTIVVLLIMSVPDLLNAGFDPSYLLGNAMVSNYSDVLDTYVYQLGLAQGQFSLATAVGICRMLVGLVLILSANAVARKVSEYSLF
jgi:putative aldouronate transport system permease protein